jgi:hypothetical protein
MAEAMRNWGNTAHRRPRESKVGQQAGHRDQRAERRGARAPSPAPRDDEPAPGAGLTESMIILLSRLRDAAAAHDRD